jgi:hypothetical protein
VLSKFKIKRYFKAMLYIFCIQKKEGEIKITKEKELE